jgi:hypothetical protein
VRANIHSKFLKGILMTIPIYSAQLADGKKTVRKSVALLASCQMSTPRSLGPINREREPSPVFPRKPFRLDKRGTPPRWPPALFPPPSGFPLPGDRPTASTLSPCRCAKLQGKRVAYPPPPPKNLFYSTFVTSYKHTFRHYFHTRLSSDLLT